MTENPLRGFRLKVFRALQFFAPEGSSLDAIFSSYDDWRRFRAHSSQAKAAGPASELSPQSPQAESQRDSSRK